MAEVFTSLMKELRTLTNSNKTNSAIENARSCNTKCFDKQESRVAWHTEGDDFSSYIEDLQVDLPSHSVANSAYEAPEIDNRPSLYQAGSNFLLSMEIPYCL